MASSRVSGLMEEEAGPRGGSVAQQALLGDAWTGCTRGGPSEQEDSPHPSSPNPRPQTTTQHGEGKELPKERGRREGPVCPVVLLTEPKGVAPKGEHESWSL